MNLRPQSLFGRTAISISLTLLAFMIIAVSAATYFIYIPVAKRYAEDFSAVIVSAAHSLQSLPEDMHTELQQQLHNDHGLTVAQQLTELSEDYSQVTYYPFFRESLARRVGDGLSINASAKEHFIWVDVPAHGKLFQTVPNLQGAPPPRRAFPGPLAIPG